MNNNTELQTFSFQSHTLTALTDEHGEPYFIAKEVCDILEHSNVSTAVSRLDDDEKLTYTMFISGQNREVLLINESGLYSLILTSRKPEAKTFKKWVTSEVLPTIRKTGGYNTQTQHLLTQLNEKDQLLIGSLQAQITYLQEQLASNQSALNGAMKLIQEEMDKVSRLKRARSKVTYLERQQIFDLHDNGWDIAQLADWAGRSRPMLKKIIAGGRHV